MSGRRRKSKKLTTTDAESDEYEQSFTMDEVKENMRTIGEKFLKWIIEGVQPDSVEKVEKMADSVRQTRRFLITRKKRVEHSKSSRQLKQLETISPLLDSANYLSSVAKDYLNKIKEPREKDKPQEHEETNVHESSFVDMFLDESQENAGGKSEPQKNTFPTQNMQNISQPLEATPSKSILKTAFSETPGIQKKISFAEKATKVYEDNQTSQISLAKSSGSVKSVDDYEPKVPNRQLATNGTGSNSDTIQRTQMSIQENSKLGSEEMFDDGESIVDTSFQEDTIFRENPKNVKLFKAKHLMDLSRLKDDSSSDANPVGLPQVESQQTEPDPLLSQESPNLTHNARESTKDQQTDAMLPFHNFVLTLPNDSSGSEASLDARVNMAINLVNMKPREPEAKQQFLPDKVETPKNSSDGIIQSSLTSTDFRSLQPIEYNRGTSQDSWQEIRHYEEPKLPVTIFEDAISGKNLLPPFDIHNENDVKTFETHVLGNPRQETGIHGHEIRSQLSSSMFPPKPTWANPFQTNIAQFNSTHQEVEIELVAPKPENLVKDKIQSQVQSKNRGYFVAKKGQGNRKKKEEMPNIGKTSEKSHLQPSQEVGVMPKGSTFPHGAQRPSGTADMLQETYNSHKAAEIIKYKSRTSFKHALQYAVQTASTRQAPDKPQEKDPVDSKIAGESNEQPESTAKTIEDSSKIARLRRFGRSWNDPSSTPLPDTEINPTRTQSNSKLCDGTSTSKSTSMKGKETVNAKSPVKRKPRIKSKPSQGKVQTASSEEHYAKLDGGKDRISGNLNPTEVGKIQINRKNEKSESLNEQTTLLGTKRVNKTQKPIHISSFPTSTTPLPDTILLDTAQLENPPRSENEKGGLSQTNPSSTICKTSFSGEKSSQSQRKQTNSSQKKNKSSQNQPKIAKQQPQGQPNLSQGNKPVIKRGRGRPPNSGDVGNPAKKCVMPTTLGSVPTGQSYPEPQPVVPYDYVSFGNTETKIQHPRPAAQQSLQPSKFDFEQGQSLSSKQDSVQTGYLFQTSWHQEPTQEKFTSSKRNPAQTQPGFLTVQQQATTDSFQQLAINPSANTETGKPGHAQCGSAQNEPWLLNWQPDGQAASMSKEKESGGGSFFEPLPENTSNQFVQLFNQPSNAVNFGQNKQTVQTDWQFNLPSTSRYEPSYQNCLSVQMLSETQIQASKMNWTNTGQINGGTDDRRDNITTEARPHLPTTVPTDGHHMEGTPSERTAGSQTNKRARKQDSQQPKSQKIMKLNETGTQDDDTDNLSRSLGTQGTEILYEECENLSWASDDFPQLCDMQMINTEMFDTYILDSEICPLSQSVDPRATSNSFQTAENECNQAEDELPHQYDGGFTGECKGSTARFQASETQDNDKHHDHTEEEEIQELLNGIEWVRRIPESELIESANIEELINEQTFVW